MINQKISRPSNTSMDRLIRRVDETIAMPPLRGDGRHRHNLGPSVARLETGALAQRR